MVDIKNEKLLLRLSGITLPMWIRSLHIVEKISQLYEITLVARCDSPDIDLELPIGRDASLEMSIQMAEHTLHRHWTGLCTDMAQTRVEPNGVSTYAITIRPRLWMLSQRTNYRLFQHVTIVDIATKLLDEWQIDHDLRLDSARYPVLELRTQYGESDHAFLSRLLEEAGISYFFEDVAGSSQMVLSDAPQKASARLRPLPFTDEPSLHAPMGTEFATSVNINHRALPATFASRDFDFRRPNLPLAGAAEEDSAAEKPWEQFYYAPGGFLHERNDGGSTPHADDKGPGRHEEGFGNERTALAMRRLRAEKRAVRFDANVIDLYPGRVFRIVNHPHQSIATSLLALDNTLARDMDGKWTVHIKSVPTTTPYHPPYSASKPRVEAVQTATVVGPKGEEIHTDEYGRVRVQFPWDRYGNFDEESSCWMRVNQGWAGAGFGSLNLPRIGQDVLVAFLDGNPDHPILVGRVFNETEPVPYKLPENKTVSTWKSNSSPSNGGFNELRFEDAAGRELVYFQAQKDAMNLVKNNEMRVVGGDRSRLVRGHETETVAQNHTRLVKGGASRTVGDNETTTVGKNRIETIGEASTSSVGKLFSVTIARSLGAPLGKTFSGAYEAMGPVLAKALTSTLGKVPSTALGLPFGGSEHGPMAGLAKSLLPKAMQLLQQGVGSIMNGGGRPPTNMSMVDEEIVLSTGGASIKLKGDDIILSAAGNITSTSKKDTKIFAQSGSITMQGGPMVYINPGEKSAEAMKMAQASKAGAAFIGSGH